MADIVVSGSLVPSTADTPLDRRCRVETLLQVESIENPFTGMLFFCEETGLVYVVKTLTQVQVGIITTSRIATYEALPAAAQISDLLSRLTVLENARSDPAELVFDIAGLSEDSRASLIVELCPDTGFSEENTLVYDSADEETNAAFKTWGGFAAGAFPAAGINSVYNSGQAIFKIPEDNQCEYYRFYWRSEAGNTEGSTTSMRYGRLHAVRHAVDFAELGF